jgi:SAM-dependent methyltransferase
MPKMSGRAGKVTADLWEQPGAGAARKHSNSEQWLVCPSCGEAIRESGDSVGCACCQQRWPVVDGIPHFVQEFPYRGEFPIDQMREVNRMAATTNWRSALLESEESSVQRASEMILNLERANWHWLLNLPARSRVLDVGAGMGTDSHALALRFRQIMATEPDLDRIQFMRQRFAQERLSNIKIVRTSVWDLPFAEQSMDLVAMNGVLEWVAEGVPGDPGELQRQALRKVVRLLRTGGYLYLGIENRYVPRYFLGYPDPHCKLPWVTVLPRPLAQWLARRKSADGYRNYLYSSKGYRKLLQEAGLSDIKLYAAIPSYTFPRFLIPLKGPEYQHYARSFEGSPKSLLLRAVKTALLKANFLQNLAPSFAILARR